MKTLFLLLYMFFGLWVIALGDKHEHVGIEPVGETDGVVLFSLLGDKLPFSFLGGAIDHTDIEVVNLAPIDEPYTDIGSFVRSDNAHLSIDAARFRDRKVGSMGCLNGNGLVTDMVYRIVLGETSCCRQYDNQYEKQPLHVAKIEKN